MLSRKESVLLSSGHCLDLDVIPEPNEEKTSNYSKLIGKFLWVVELDCIDIIREDTMGRNSRQPR